jgi:hypothetical protein
MGPIGSRNRRPRVEANCALAMKEPASMRGVKWGGLIVQAIAIASALALCLSAFTPARAQQTNDCKSCREYQQACLKNHTRDACNNEYSICMKYCKKK